MRVKILGKTVLKTYNHYYQCLQYSELRPVVHNRLNHFIINKDNFDLINGSNDLKKMLIEQPNYIRGFGFFDNNDNIVGYFFLAYKGGTELLYKIRNIDAYIFAVKVFDEYRGRQYAGEMLTWISQELHKEGFDKMYLTVKKDNYAAIKAYKRLGFKTIGTYFFIRIAKMNIPYYTL